MKEFISIIIQTTSVLIKLKGDLERQEYNVGIQNPTATFIR